MTISTIIFDLDDTLLWDKKSIAEAFRLTCEEAAEKLGETIDFSQLEEDVRAAARTLYEAYPVYAYTQMIGINPFEGLWGDFDDPTPQFQEMKELVPSYRRDAWTNGLRSYGIEDAALGAYLGEYFVAARKRSPFLYKETFEVLEQLKEKYQLVLLTNGAPSLQNTKLEITPELVPYFDHIIISGDFGKGKPDASIFDHVLKTANITAEEGIMVGDNLMTDILGSSRINMKNVWINRENKEPSPIVTPTFEIDDLKQLQQIVTSI
ncbi:MAG: HAD family hydrolase [Kurthia sp.]|nr:HAD family hydrolase [Candidatus Kurthia equi]